MPTYQYLCTECGHAFEQVQKFSDDALTTCPECTGKLRKVFNSVGVVFKGSGFYKTDSKSSSTAAPRRARRGPARRVVDEPLAERLVRVVRVVGVFGLVELEHGGLPRLIRGPVEDAGSRRRGGLRSPAWTPVHPSTGCATPATADDDGCCAAGG